MYMLGSVQRYESARGEQNRRTPLVWAGEGWSETSALRQKPGQRSREGREDRVPSGRRKM